MSETAFTIDTGKEGDAARISAFQVAMADETEDFGLDPATVGAGVRAMLAMPERGFYVVARNGGGEAVGSLLVLKEWSDWRNCDVWWIHSLYVEPGSRRKGLFAAMYDFVCARAKENGVAGIRLYVERGNHNAKKAYDAIGMSNEHYELYEKMLDQD